jgi:hypothetical protein
MTHRCPICKAETDSQRDADFPFCSERCRLLDLGAWASEKYVISEAVMDEDTNEEPGAKEASEKN